MTLFSLLLQCIAYFLYVVEAKEYDQTNYRCGNGGKTYNTIINLHQARLGKPNLRAVHAGRFHGRSHIDETSFSDQDQDILALSDEIDEIHCSSDYAPVCGTDGKIYSNECYLKANEENDPTLRIKHNGPCRGHSKDKSCPSNLDPVCGSDGETYKNKCLFNKKKKHNHHLRIKHGGSCVKELDEIMCGLDYDPVCGSDGKTYGNLCRLDANSLYHPTLHIKHYGLCSEKFQEIDYEDEELTEEVAKCPLIGTPVCGTDGKTYSNMCFLSFNRFYNFALSIRHYGRCKEDYEDLSENVMRDNKNKPCVLIWRPVCGTNGKTYGSKCFLNEDKVDNPTLSIKHYGQCKDNPKRSNKSVKRFRKPNRSVTKIDIKNSDKNENNIYIDLRLLN